MKDVVIIGGGVVGLWCAWHLVREGKQVTVIDRNELIDGCSFGNAGMIVPSHFTPLASPGIISKGIRWMFRKDSPFYIRPRLNLELAQWLYLFYRSTTKKHVSESASLLKDLHEESRELYRMLNQSPGFNFGFEQKGILMLYKTEAAEKDEIETAEAAHQLGIEAIQLSVERLKEVEPGLQMSVKGAMYYPGDAHLIPQLFMQQMISHLNQSGVEFYTSKTVTGIQDDRERNCTVLLKDGEIISCKNVIVASGSWSGKLMQKSGYYLPMQDGKGYSMILKSPPLMPVIPSILHEARVAITPMGNDLRISGTLEISGMDDLIKEHKVNGILKSVPEYYPEMDMTNPGQVWYGYRPCTPDGMPYVGRFKKDSNIILATGHAMMGLSLAPATGRMVVEVLQKNPKNWNNNLDPARFSKG
jgi:D-amino-acid dehydrogenase